MGDVKSSEGNGPAQEFATAAAQVIKRAQEETDLSLMELSAVFKIAGTVCEVANATHEAAAMAAKIRGWRLPGQ